MTGEMLDYSTNGLRRQSGNEFDSLPLTSEEYIPYMVYIVKTVKKL